MVGTIQRAQCKENRSVQQSRHTELAWEAGAGLYRIDSPELRRPPHKQVTEEQDAGEGAQKVRRERKALTTHLLNKGEGTKDEWKRVEWGGVGAIIGGGGDRFFHET